MSSPVTVFLPACWASKLAFCPIWIARSSRMSRSASHALGLTRPAPAFLSSLSSAASGSSVMDYSLFSLELKWFLDAVFIV